MDCDFFFIFYFLSSGIWLLLPLLTSLIPHMTVTKTPTSTPTRKPENQPPVFTTPPQPNVIPTPVVVRLTCSLCAVESSFYVWFGVYKEEIYFLTSHLAFDSEDFRSYSFYNPSTLSNLHYCKGTFLSYPGSSCCFCCCWGKDEACFGKRNNKPYGMIL